MRHRLARFAVTVSFIALGFPVFAQQRQPPGRAAEPPAEDVGADTASHREIAPLHLRFRTLTALAMHPDGSLLAADGPASEIKVIAPDGTLARTLRLPFHPEAMAAAPDGDLYCGGEGRLARFTRDGELLKSAAVPTDAEQEVSAVSRQRARGLPTRISGIAVSDRDVFVAFGSGWSLGSKSKLYRFDRNWENPKPLAEGLRGCCQRCDVVTRNGELFLAENAAHRVVIYDRDGQVLRKWGTRGRMDLEGFGSCCNPMNLAFDAAGDLYTAESGLGRIKRYSRDGAFLGLVGYVGVERFTNAGQLAASCSNIAIAVTPDGQRVYVMDFKQNLIRVLGRKD